MKKSALLLPATLLALIGLAVSFSGCETSQPRAAFTPAIPQTWDAEALATLEVPLADPKFSARHVPTDYYHRIPVRPIYRSYSIYYPGKEPRKDYLAWLKEQEPEVIWGEGKTPPLATEEDWIKAGEMVFDAAIGTDQEVIGNVITLANVQDRSWYQQTKMPLAQDHHLPFARFVIRKRGNIEVGNLSCAYCHTFSVLLTGRATIGSSRRKRPNSSANSCAVW